MTILDTIPNRDHLRIATRRDVLTPSSLGEIHETLGSVVARQEPIDHTKPLAHYHFSIEPVSDGIGNEVRATLRPLRPEGGLGEPLGFTKTGLRQFASRVLPSRGLGFVDSLVELGDAGRKLAELNVAAFSRQQTAPSMVRTAVLDRESGSRFVRAIASDRYSVLDDLDVVRTLLDEPETRDLPVLAYRRDDTGSILRLALDPEALAADSLRYPAVEWSNSEVGLGALNLRSGIFQQICTNGLWGWGSDSFSARWIHSGGASAGDRIRQGIVDAMGSARLTANGVLDRYGVALDTAIDDVFAFLDAALGRDFSGVAIKAIGEKVGDDANPESGNLASAVDAVTLYAQDVPVVEQRQIETAAAKLLDFGLRHGADGSIRTDRTDDGKAIVL